MADHGLVWQKGTVTDIGTLGGPATAAMAINNLGQIVGWSQTSTAPPTGSSTAPAP